MNRRRIIISISLFIYVLALWSSTPLKETSQNQKFFRKSTEVLQYFFFLDSAGLQKNPPMGPETRFMNTSGGEPIPPLPINYQCARLSRIF